MHTPQTRANLEQCRSVLATLDISDELRLLADNMLDHLLSMHDDGRLSIPVFLLAADSLELVPGLEQAVARLRATAGRELAA